MYIAISLIVVAIGAILQVGVADKVESVNLDKIGMILIVLGIVGFVLALIAELFNRRRHSERIIEQDGRVASREEVREQL